MGINLLINFKRREPDKDIFYAQLIFFLNLFSPTKFFQPNFPQFLLKKPSKILTQNKPTKKQSH